jgi:hypothetical protein
VDVVKKNECEALGLRPFRTLVMASKLALEVVGLRLRMPVVTAATKFINSSSMLQICTSSSTHPGAWPNKFQAVEIVTMPYELPWSTWFETWDHWRELELQCFPKKVEVRNALLEPRFSQ